MHLDADPRLLPIDLRRELISAGHTDRTLAQALRRGTLARPRRGAYVDGPTWATLNADQRYVLYCRAAYRQAATDVVLSHTSALPFLDAPVWGVPRDEAHLTRRDAQSGRREAGVRQHRGLLLDGDAVTRFGIDVSSPLRATLEVGAIASVEATLVVANHFLHRSAFTLGTLVERYEGTSGCWPHTLGMNIVLRLADARLESVGETRTAYFLFRRRFPRPIPQMEIEDGGRVVAKLDFALPDHGAWIEFDGMVKYEGHLGPGESASDAVVREKRREEHVAELTGWRCFRVTWSDLDRPERLEARLRSFLERVDRSRRTA